MSQETSRSSIRKRNFPAFAYVLAIFFLVGARKLNSQQQAVVWSPDEQHILDQIKTLRSLSEGQRSQRTKELAQAIRKLPAAPNKLRLAVGLASLSTEGDQGQDTLQEVATTLANALQQEPAPPTPKGPSRAYLELARLVRYEHAQVSLDDPQYAKAMADLDAEEQALQQADFSLPDLKGKMWSLKGLRGQVVLVNFWATWCPPCRSEMPDLDSIYRHFKKEGLVVLAISDEDLSKVKPFAEHFGADYPILLDHDRKVHQAFSIDGIPRSFLYDREGKLVAQAIDMRTKRQFQQMLAQAGLRR